ncbi:MAG: hypothetical protein AAGI07_16555, partial [Bacteroidota bacterium]
QVETHQSDIGETINSMALEYSKSLQYLHELLINSLEKHLSHQVNSTSFLGNGCNESSINWVNQYISKHSFSNFSPHITLGIGQFKGKFIPKESIAKRLAVCHLGNYCTCREILFETQINNSKTK